MGVCVSLHAGLPVSTLLSTSGTKVLIPTPHDVMTLSSQSLQHYCNYLNFKLNSTKRHQHPTNVKSCFQRTRRSKYSAAGVRIKLCSVAAFNSVPIFLYFAWVLWPLLYYTHENLSVAAKDQLWGLSAWSSDCFPFLIYNTCYDQICNTSKKYLMILH